MTITRLFLYATLAACPLWASMALAHAGPEDAPASAASTGGPSASQAGLTAAHAKATPATKKAVKHSVTQQASVDGGYHLPHPQRQIDSYQRAVTPPVTTDR